MEQATTKRDKHNLTIKQRFDLMNLVQAEYAARAENDPDFARYASEKLGFPLNANHVGSSRDALGIPATKYSTAAGSSESRLTLIERRLALLEDLVNKTLKESVPPQPTGFGTAPRGSYGMARSGE